MHRLDFFSRVVCPCLSYMNGVFVAGSAGRPLNVRLFNVLQSTGLLDWRMGGSLLSWGGRVVVCLEGRGVVIVLQGAALPPIPGIGSGDVPDLFFSLFLSLLLFRQVRSGRMGSDGLPWRPKCVVFFPFCDAWVRVTGQVPEEVLEKICQI